MMLAAKLHGYNQTYEDTYTLEHPELIKRKAYFQNIMLEQKIFVQLSEQLIPKNLITAQVVATGWHQFSIFMPWALSYSAAMVSNNLMRHYIIQGAYEELGLTTI